MKKSFLEPEAQIIVLQVKDIVTASEFGEDIFDGDGEDVIPEDTEVGQ